MNHRHLLPNEIDLLLDGEVGFGVAPLRAHVAECGQCASALDASRTVVEALDHLPRFRPSPLFAERVLAETRIFEPWHVAALDTARRYLPAGTPARVLVAAGASTMALVITFITVWLSSRLDALLFVGQLLLNRGRDLAIAGANSTLAALLGESALTALRDSGSTGLAMAIAAALGAAFLAAGGLHAATAASDRTT